MFDTSEEANQKLSKTIVFFDKRPTYILEASGNKKDVTLYHVPLKGKDSLKHCIWDKAWDLRRIGSRVGYANADIQTYKEAVFMTRMPVRQAHNTQGLSQRNINIPVLKGSSRLGLQPLSLQFQSVYNTGWFSDMLEDKYPGLENIGKMFSKDAWLRSVAFNREFAVRKGDVGPFYLEYKGKDIGYSDDIYRFKIADQFDYLCESLDNINVKVA